MPFLPAEVTNGDQLRIKETLLPATKQHLHEHKHEHETMEALSTGGEIENLDV
jgi:hypothetical protein